MTDTIPTDTHTTVVRMSRNPEITACHLQVDGQTVPYIDVFQLADGTFTLELTRPGGGAWLGMDIATEDEINRWSHFLANAMAVAAGRTSHGPHSRPHNPHGENWFFDSDDSRLLGTPMEESPGA